MLWLRPIALLILLPLPAGAQWRHFGPSSSVSAAPISHSMLEAHNEVRARVNVPPLAWSDRLAGIARDWAFDLVRSRQFYHRPNSRLGENLFEISGAHASPGEVVQNWASEVKEYSYRANSCRGVCGHYTQLVWRSTKEVGCAVARGEGREIWVCNYDPPGNWIGERPY